MTIALYDSAGIARQARESMKEEAAKIFLEAGVELVWLDCEVAGRFLNYTQCAQPLGPHRLMLQLVSGSKKNTPTVTGMAFTQGEASVFACLYVDRVRELALESNWEFGELLGHAAAHEIGHLLLRSSGHAPAGVMRAPWEVKDLRRLSHSGLIFLDGQLAPFTSGSRF
ncbi:MAG: hypothetical protein R2762_29165 [Bryobacteraceae bacterium]